MPSLSNSRIGSTAQIYGNEWGSKYGRCDNPVFLLEQKHKQFWNIETILTTKYSPIFNFQYKFFFFSLETRKMCCFQLHLRYGNKQVSHEKTKAKLKKGKITLLGMFQRFQTLFFFHFSVNVW